MEVEEFEERAKSIVEVELKKIRSIVKKIPGNNAKKQAKLLGLSTIDEDIKSNPHAFNVLKNFVANMILEQVEGKSGKINYERIISEIVNHIMTFCNRLQSRFTQTYEKGIKKIRDTEGSADY